MKVLTLIAGGLVGAMVLMTPARAPGASFRGVGFLDPNRVGALFPDPMFEAVHFPDPNLEATVRAALSRVPRPMTHAAMLTLDGLDLVGVSDLTGLEHAENLTILVGFGRYWQEGNQIADLTPLSGLHDLRELELPGNAIEQLGPLSNLTNLITLYLSDNRITTIAPLADLTKLRHLALYGNNIEDISVVAPMRELRILTLDDNQISDISAFADLTNLRNIGLWQNAITDISPLVHLAEFGDLVFVDLRGNPLNEDAYSVHIPQIQEYNPEVILYYDPIPEPGTSLLLLLGVFCVGTTGRYKHNRR